VSKHTIDRRTFFALTAAGGGAVFMAGLFGQAQAADGMAMPVQPDFVLVKTVRLIPGEHDASLDRGAAFRDFFGPTFVIPSTTREYTLLHSTTCPTRVPDLKLRADLAPGQVVRLSCTPTAPGTIDFLCDNFCGSGHEEMNGKFIVKAWTEAPCVC
jgi:hypothetical protein